MQILPGSGKDAVSSWSVARSEYDKECDNFYDAHCEKRSKKNLNESG